jgi:hypothetical protein
MEAFALHKRYGLQDLTSITTELEVSVDSGSFGLYIDERTTFEEFGVSSPKLTVVIRRFLSESSWCWMTWKHLFRVLDMEHVYPANPFEIIGGGEVERFDLVRDGRGRKRGFLILERGVVTRALFGRWSDGCQPRMFLMHPGDKLSPADHIRNRLWFANAYRRLCAARLLEPLTMWKRGGDYVARSVSEQSVPPGKG